MKEFEVEILFHTASAPKRMKAVSVYTKDALLCIQRKDGMLVKYPLLNIFQVAHMHGPHCNSEVEDYIPGEKNGQTEAKEA